MTRNLLRAGALSCALLASTALTTPAVAQNAPPAPVRQNVDGNGVDLFLGGFNLDVPLVSIGSGPSALVYSRNNRGSDNVSATLFLSGNVMKVSLGGVSDSFTVSGGTYTPTEGNGATLSYNSTTFIYTYTAADGTVIRFDKNRSNTSYANEGRVLDVTRPSGEKLVYAYASLSYCSSYKDGDSGTICLTHSNAYRLASVRNSYGYALAFNYSEYEFHDPDDPFADLTPWHNLEGVSSVNLAGASTNALATASFATSTSGANTYLDMTDAAGRTTRYRTSGSSVGITLPGSSSENVTATYTSGRVSSIQDAAGTTTYAVSDSGGERTVTVTNSSSQAVVYVFDIASRRLKSVTDPLSRTTSYQYDSAGRVTRITAPEGNYTQLTYDARGNVTERRAVAKSGSSLADVVTSATFASSCSNPVTCNLPTSTTDARGNVTDYTYDSTHGGVLTVTAPAPTTNAVRPQMRYSYSTLQAYFRNSVGSIVASGEAMTLATGSSTCQTQSSCTGTADEVVTSVSYGPQTTGVGNNLLPVSTSSGAGDNSLTATVATSYDDVGNVVAVDGPLSGSADTSRFRYNAARQQVGAISPDPDGSGSLLHRAVRTTFSSTTGLPTKVEQGTVAGTSDTDWAAFSAAQGQEVEYDSQLRPVVQRLVSGSTTYALTQTGYDSLSRVRCVAQRMNSAEFATSSLPSDACTLDTEGSHGPDRIARTSYDAAGQVIKQESAVGVTGVQADEVVATFTGNGQAETLTDGEGNKTTYVYDGHDRLSRTRFPSGTQGSGSSSTTDYEELTYDAGSNVTSQRLRDGNTIAFTYDALNRLIFQDLPIGWGADRALSYDNLGRMTQAAQPSLIFAVDFTYDALGRQLSESGPSAYTTYEYDAAGRRTRLHFNNGGPSMHYDHLVTGELSAIRENGATSGAGVLATFGYDNLGRRTSLTRGNGAVTSYTYDAVSRLASQSEDLSGTSHDQSSTFTFNPAGQIASVSRTNDTYAFTGHANASRTDTHNGRNQVTASGSTSVTHDARGNTDWIGATSYVYDLGNRLVQASGGPVLNYDPLGRLTNTYNSNDYAGTAAYFARDGARIIGEAASSGGIARRYVFGEGLDEALVQYEGSGTSDRRWLHADERGSVVAVSDGSGAATAVNRYDEYGNPQGGTIAGRFGYTGQAWLPELGMWYYKARIYNPDAERGGTRFMQLDQTGYGDGMNGYVYVGGDPVNRVDPTGNWTDIIVHGTRRRRRELSPPPFNRDIVDAMERLGGVMPEEPIVVNGERVRQCPNTLTLTESESDGVTRLTFRGRVEFLPGDYDRVTTLPVPHNRGVSEFERDFYRRNLGWNGRVGRYQLETFLEEGPGGMTVYVGEVGPGAGINYRGSGAFILPHIQPGTPGIRSYLLNTMLPHEFLHSLGKDHNYHPQSEIMSTEPLIPQARLREIDVESGIESCK